MSEQGQPFEWSCLAVEDDKEQMIVTSAAEVGHGVLIRVVVEQSQGIAAALQFVPYRYLDKTTNPVTLGIGSPKSKQAQEKTDVLGKTKEEADTDATSNPFSWVDDGVDGPPPTP